MNNLSNILPLNQLDQATQNFNTAVTLLGMNRRRPGSQMALLPRQVCQLIVQMTFPRHLKPDSTYNTDDKFLELIAKTPLVTSVDLSNCTPLSERSIVALAQRFRRLEWIKCSGDNDNLKTLATHCPDLKYIEVTGRTHTGMIRVESLKALRGCQKLMSLSLGKSNSYSLEQLTRLIPKLPHLKKYVGGAHDAVLEALANHCPNLTDLSVHEPLGGITDDALKSLAPKFRNLRSIALNHLLGITDKTLDALSWHCHNLQSVEVEFCGKITDKGIINLTDNLADIRRLSVACCRITDEAMIAFAKKHTKVTHLYLESTRITDETLFALAKNCHELVEIKVANTDITEKGIAALTESCPGLQKSVIFYTPRGETFAAFFW